MAVEHLRWPSSVWGRGLTWGRFLELQRLPGIGRDVGQYGILVSHWSGPYPSHSTRSGTDGYDKHHSEEGGLGPQYRRPNPSSSEKEKKEKRKKKKEKRGKGEEKRGEKRGKEKRETYPRCLQRWALKSKYIKRYDRSKLETTK
jgi:hypothetical protein